MFGQKNPLKELEGNEYKLAREEGFAQGKRTGWFVSALVGIPGIALAVIAGIASGGVAIALFPLAALVGSLVVGAVAQMHSDRRNSKRAANLLLAQRELLDQKKEGEGQEQAPNAPEQANAKGQGQEKPAAPQKGKGAAPQPQGNVPQPAGMAPPQPAPQAPALANGYAPPMPQSYHSVAMSPQAPSGAVMGQHTANLAQRGAPMPAYNGPARG